MKHAPRSTCYWNYRSRLYATQRLPSIIGLCGSRKSILCRDVILQTSATRVMIGPRRSRGLRGNERIAATERERGTLNGALHSWFILPRDWSSLQAYCDKPVDSWFTRASQADSWWQSLYIYIYIYIRTPRLTSSDNSTNILTPSRDSFTVELSHVTAPVDWVRSRTFIYHQFHFIEYFFRSWNKINKTGYRRHPINIAWPLDGCGLGRRIFSSGAQRMANSLLYSMTSW